MARAQKTTSLQVIIAHRTASAVALSVIAGMVPADLSRTNELGLGAGRTSKQGWRSGGNNKGVEAQVPSIDHTYRLTQALTGHGCYQGYLHRIGRISETTCLY